MRGTKTMVLNIPKPVRKPTIMETLKVEFLKSEKGTIGWSVRSSTMKKMARRRAAAANSPRTSGDVQPWSRVIESATISGTRPAISKPAPGKSMSRMEAEEDRDQAHRQVDVEHPPPAPAVGDISAGCGADDG